jgi:hypothetical protein
MFSVHVAWRVRAGRVLLWPDGAPQAVMFAPPRSDLWKDAALLTCSIARFVDEVHERAGLFAWKEPVKTFGSWAEMRLAALVEEIWAQATVMEVDDAAPDFDQSRHRFACCAFRTPDRRTVCSGLVGWLE